MPAVFFYCSIVDIFKQLSENLCEFNKIYEEQFFTYKNWSDIFGC